MEFVFNSNFDLPQYGTCDLSFTEGDPLTSAVLASVLCNRRVTKEELPPDQTRQQGWWADTLNKRKFGSKLWLTKRANITPAMVPQIKLYVLESLQWMLDDKLCDSFEVRVERDQNRDRVNIFIGINKDNRVQNIVLRGI